MVANFHVLNFDNDKTFYTDSNGLEMQKRILNYRPTWNIEDNYVDDSQKEDITANYYPITSAISMKDKGSDRVFTVMNDRTQGGSALSAGNIEMMQNRRVLADDDRGVAENLDEIDIYGHGYRVPATYYVQIFKEKQRPNLQREVQQLVDLPQSQFYAFKVPGVGYAPPKRRLQQQEAEAPGGAEPSPRIEPASRECAE